MQFSQRHGFKNLKEVMQIESIDIETLNGLWSGLQMHYWNNVPSYDLRREVNSDYNELFTSIWLNFFKLPVDRISYDKDIVISEIRAKFFKLNWFEVYDFIEFVPQNYMAHDQRGFPRKQFREFCNTLFERENCGYRFINDIISPITTQQEIEEIEAAINNTFSQVSTHFNRSLELLSDKVNPDYRNSIKESISAVESLCKILTDKPKATLGEALSVIEKNYTIHSALKKAFSNLYGYTNDESGIRHALLEDTTLKFEDAKFMLVSCSSFTNYLKCKMI